MADEDAALTDESLWWGPDAPDDAPLPPASFDEPVAWPETIEWPLPAAEGDVLAGAAISAPLPPVDDDLLFDAEPPSPTAPAPQVDAMQQADAVQPDGMQVDGMAPLPVAAADDAGTDFQLEPLPESIWDADPDPLVPEAPTEAAGAPAAAAMAPLTQVGPRAAIPATPFYAEAEHRRPGTFGGRFQLRSPKGVMVGVAAVAALALFAIVLSNRNGSNVGSTASPNSGAAGNIVTQGLPSSTVPGTSTTVAGPPSSVAAADAPPPPADAAASADSGGTAAGPAAGGGTSRPATPATAATTTPARAAAPAGQGGGSAPSAADTPAPAPAPTPPPATQPPATSPPDTVPATTTPTAPPHTRPSIPEITAPSIPVTTTVASDVPTITTRPKRTTD